MSRTYRCDRCGGKQADFELYPNYANSRYNPGGVFIQHAPYANPIPYDLCQTCANEYRDLVSGFFKKAVR